MQQLNYKRLVIAFMLIGFLDQKSYSQVQDKAWEMGMGPGLAFSLPYEDGATFGLHWNLSRELNSQLKWSVRSSYHWTEKQKTTLISSGRRKIDFKPFFQWQAGLGLEFVLLGNGAGEKSSPWNIGIMGQLGFSYGSQVIEIKETSIDSTGFIEESIKSKHKAFFISSGLTFSYALKKSSIYIEVLPQLDFWSRTADNNRKYDPNAMSYIDIDHSSTETGLEFSGLYMNLGYRFRW